MDKPTSITDQTNQEGKANTQTDPASQAHLNKTFSYFENTSDYNHPRSDYTKTSSNLNEDRPFQTAANSLDMNSYPSVSYSVPKITANDTLSSKSLAKVPSINLSLPQAFSMNISDPYNRYTPRNIYGEIEYDKLSERSNAAAAMNEYTNLRKFSTQDHYNAQTPTSLHNLMTISERTYGGPSLKNSSLNNERLIDFGGLFHQSNIKEEMAKFTGPYLSQSSIFEEKSQRSTVKSPRSTVRSEVSIETNRTKDNQLQENTYNGEVNRHFVRIFNSF